MKQAAKVWYEKLNSILNSYNFSQSKVDSCLYTKEFGDEVIYIIIHVGDFLIAFKKIEEITKAAEFLKSKFNLVNLRIFKRYLGIEIRRDGEGFYCIKQTKYIETILRRFGLDDAKPTNIALNTGYLTNRKNYTSMTENDKYHQFIRAVLYIAVNIIPDISASVMILGQCNKQPTADDWTEVKRVGRYLKSIKDYELTLGQKGERKGLEGYTDADWTENRNDRKSNSGYVFKFLNATISWGCRKQTCIAL